MVAMGGAGGGERDVEPAMDAAEGFGAAVVTTPALSSGQLDVVSGYAEKADGIGRRRAPDMERPSRWDGLELSGQGWSYERAVLRRREATAAATQAEDMSSVSFPVRRPR